MSAAIMTIAVGNAYANPQDGVVSAGAATITSSGNTLNIHQSTQKAIIDWRSFDIGASETTQFHQPSSSSVTLNRVHSSSASFIDGHLIANGNIFIVNQNGVVFGQNSRVDVNGLVASTANISDANFMAGNFRFDQAGNPNATIENRGQITAAEAGLVGLVAPNVLNSGIIHAKMGRVHLASGDRATVDLYGDGLIEVSADDYAGQRVVQNTGKITAEGGTIAMTAAAGATMVNSLIRVSGELHAPSVGVKNGKIIIGAEGSNAVKGNVASNKGKKSGSSKVIVDGIIEASGKNPGEKGGSITITADHIEVLSNALIDATGSAGGGRISIGGASVGTLDASGVLPTIDQTAPVALTTTIQQNALIDASAIDVGDGGSVTVYSDEVTLIDGDIRAAGAGDDGNGGFADTSGHKDLIVNGTVTLSGGRRGRKGEWLLDPADITITGPDTNISGGPNYTPTGTGSQVSAATIVANLNAGTNVTITTANNAYAGNGDIFVNSAITTTGTGSLTLSAYRDITVSSAITLNGGSLTLRADNTGADSGAISVTAGISTNGGNIIMGGGSGVISAGNGYAAGSATYTHGINVTSSLYAGSGNIIINGKSRISSLSNVYGVQISGNVATTGSGTISINGISRGITNAGNGYGSYILGTISSVNGDISITGQGGGAGSGASSYGVVFSSTGGLVRTTGAGNIIIVGTGGTGSGGSHHGVLFNNTSNNLVTTGTGAITVTGTGGTSNGTNNYGVNVNGNIVSAGGAITINGTGGLGSGTGNHGVIMSSSTNGITITNVGNGSITINGVARGTGNSGSNFGVYLNNAAVISTVNGALNITGTGGGSGFGAYNYGIHVLSGTVRTTGSGAITLVGTGGNSTGTGAYNSGIFIVTNGAIQSTGTGTISVTGTGSNSSGGGIGGISLQGSITSAGGAVTVTGTGGASSGATNVGIRLNGGSISNTGAGTVTLNGYGGGASASSANEGVLLHNGGSITTVNGALTINGTGGVGSGGGNNGIDVTTTGSSTFKTTGSGNITLNGINGAGTGYGVTLVGLSNAVQTTGTGAILINTDSINADTASSVNSIGSLTLSALTAGATMGLGTGAGTLSVSETTLNSLNAASYIFGATNLGDMDIHTTRNFGDANVTFMSGGNITLSGTLTKSSGTGTANYLFQANGNISNSGGAGVTSSSGSTNVTFTSDNDVNGAGNIVLTSAGLLTNNGTITLNSNGQTVNLSGTIGGATTINSANGNVTLGSIDGTTAGTKDLTINGGTGTFTTTGAIGFTNRLNNMTVIANDAVIGSTIDGAGTLILRPTTTTRDFNINYGTANGTNFHLNSTEVSRIQGNWSQITLGRGNITGDLNIGTTSFSRNVLFLSGTGGVSIRDGATVTTTNLASVTFQAAGHVVLSGYVTADGSITFSNGYSNYLFTSSNSGSTKYITSLNGDIIFNKGIDLYSANAVLSAVNGSVIFAGGGVSSAYSFTATAKSFSFGASLATSAGNITLNSTDSIVIPTLTTTAGRTVTVNVTGAGNSITTTGAITTGAGGNIALTADDLILGGNLSGSGTLTLQPYSSNRMVGLNYGTGQFDLSTTELNYLVDGWSLINIGRTNSTVDMYVGSTTWRDPVVFRSAYRKIFYGLTGNDDASFGVAGGGWVDVHGNIATSGGAVDFLNGSLSYVYFTGASPSVSTAGGNILLAQTYAASNLNLNAGSGAISFGSAVQGPANLSATANTITTTGAWTNLANVSLTTSSNISLSSITAQSILVNAVGATSDITLKNGSVLTASGAGSAITLVAGRNFINSSGSSTPFILTGSGRWLTYSANPADDVVNGMSSDFVRYGCTYGGSCPSGVTIPASGNGSIYVYRPILTVTPTALAALTYGDMAPVLTGYAYTVTGYLTGMAGSDAADDMLSGSLNGSTTYTSLSNVGTYEVDYASGALLSALGYDIAYANNANAITVNKKALIVTANNQSVTYGTAVPNGTVSYTGFVNGQNISVLDSLATLSSAHSGILNAGSYANNYTVSGGTDDNYSYNYVSGNLTVHKKMLDVTADNNTIIYGDAIPTTTTISYNGFITGEDASDLITAPTTVSTVTGLQNAGTYANNYTVSGGVSNNYDFNYLSGDLIIAKKDLAVSADNKSISYGSAVPTGSLTYSGFITGQNETFLDTQPIVTSANSGILNSGVYAGNYVASGGADNNYNLIYSSGTLTVTKIGVNVIVNNRSVIYGTAVPTTTLSYSGFVNGDTEADLLTQATITSAASGIVNAGSYIGNYTASGATADNYTFNYIAGDLTVNKKLLNVTAGNRTVTYGDAIPSTTLTYNGFISGEDVSFLTSAPIVTSLQSGAVNVGTYTGNYVPSGGSSNNYAFNYISGNLNVVKKNLVVTANSVAISYGNVIPGTTTLIYSGFVNGDDATDLNTAPIAVSTLSGIQNVGTYSGNYVVGGAADNNYSFTYIDGDLVIGGSMVVTPPPVSPTTPADLPNTFIHNFQNPEVNSVVSTGVPKQIAISYSIRSESVADHGSSFIEITPELANIFEITQEDIQNMNVSKIIH